MKKRKKPLIWRSSILTFVNNLEIKNTISLSAGDLESEVIWGEEDWHDLVTISYFISIVDRNCLGAENWEWYLAYFEETNDKTKIVVIDGLWSFPSPKHKHIIYLKNDNQSLHKKISQLISKEKTKIDGNYFRMKEWFSGK